MASLEPGTRLGNYEILHELGRGGMGVVYRAHEISLEREVALKVLPEYLAENPEFVKRFAREARSAARLSHPNIVNIFALGESEQRYFIAMEYVRGKNLADYMRALGQVPLTRALEIAIDVGEALAEAHQHEIIHRDIKPENIVIDRVGRVKVMDFGLAKSLDKHTNLTSTGVYLGSPRYMAPEQCRCESVDARTDLYALGVVLFEMLTATPPFEAESPLSLMRKIVDAPFPPLPTPDPVPPDTTGAQELLDKLVAKDANDRFESATAFVTAARALLRLCRAAEEEAPAPAAPPPQNESATPPPDTKFGQVPVGFHDFPAPDTPVPGDGEAPIPEDEETSLTEVDETSADATHQETPFSGVPVGGVGTGAIDVGTNAGFYHLSINNNRPPESHVRTAPHTGLTVRLVPQAGKPYIRQLRRGPQPRHQQLTGAPPLLHEEGLKARLTFPLARFQVTDPACPASVVWSHLAPLVPYDYDGSSLPVMVTRVSVRNTTDAPLEASLLFTLDNLVGHGDGAQPEQPAPGKLILVEEERRYVKRFGQREGPAPSEIQADPRRAAEAPPPPREEEMPPNNGVCFGEAGSNVPRFGGEHAVLLRAVEGTGITVNAYDPAKPGEAKRLWSMFTEAGALDESIIAADAWRAGAVCGRLEVPAGETRHFEFLFVWYIPRFECGGEDLGVAYAGARRSVREVAEHALQHLTYFHQSATNWHKRFAEASLPVWMTKMMLNSACVLTSNTVCTFNEGFGVAESPLTGRTACLDDSRLYSSLGSMLYFPRYNETELALLAHAEQPQSTGRLPRDLGRWTLRAGELNHPAPLRVGLAARFVVMAYRDYLFTGKLVRLQTVFPVISAVMAAIAALDRDGDGLPDCPEEPHHTAEGIAGQGVCCIDAGLWVVALRAYTHLCEKLRNRTDAERFRLLAMRAAEAFDRRYWDSDLGYYRLFHKGAGPNADACHTGQLSGPWYAAFLGLDGLFHAQHLDAALQRIGELNAAGDLVVAARRPDGAACSNEASDSTPCLAGDVWTSLTLGPYACMLVYRGRVAEGIECARALAERQQEVNGTAFNYYDRWDAEANKPPEGALPRHASAMAIWHVHYAVEGFLFSAPDQRLRVMPNLPEGVRSLSAPLMTPLCLGWLNYKVDSENGYRQRVRVRLDSPIQVRSFELRVPADLPQVNVRLRQTAADWVAVDYGLRPDGDAQRLFIAIRNSVLTASDILIEVVQAQPAPPQPPPV